MLPNSSSPIDVYSRIRVLDILQARLDFLHFSKSNYGGIYIIINKVNGKVYVGQTSRPLNEYLFKHRLVSLRKGNMHNPFLQKEWIDLGEESFEIYVAEYIDPQSENYQETLQNLEAFYINLFNASGVGGYNQLSTYDRNISFNDIKNRLQYKREEDIYFKKSTEKYTFPDVPSRYIKEPPYKFTNKNISASTVTNNLSRFKNMHFQTFEELVSAYITYTSKYKKWTLEEIEELHYAIAQRLRAMGSGVLPH